MGELVRLYQGIAAKLDERLEEALDLEVGLAGFSFSLVYEDGSTATAYDIGDASVSSIIGAIEMLKARIIKERVE